MALLSLSSLYIVDDQCPANQNPPDGNDDDDDDDDGGGGGGGGGGGRDPDDPGQNQPGQNS